MKIITQFIFIISDGVINNRAAYRACQMSTCSKGKWIVTAICHKRITKVLVYFTTFSAMVDWFLSVLLIQEIFFSIYSLHIVLMNKNPSYEKGFISFYPSFIRQFIF
jgi:hypothetical protein